jgi:succinate dehydrogenase / fumarate reductase, iron-sulfur subunit
MNTLWNVTFEVFRKKGDQPTRFDAFTFEVNPDEYVLDAVERIWAYHDRSLIFRHACHHSTCGACGMLVNGVEKLTCITTIRSVTQDGGTVKVQPLRNFPIVSDLVVDMGTFFRRMDMVSAPASIELNRAPHPDSETIAPDRSAPGDLFRLVDCIECGCCISACPVPLTTPEYLGPAVLAGAQHNGLERNPELMKFVDGANGVWRCHSAFECTAVCPANVEPAWRIMDLRKQVVKAKIRRFFGKK